ncbi:type II toxin-antitoxin system HicB family antitoxin [Roseateles saccharophilus]|uniref:Putative HicB family RNase H-like nuclease n=1 Tax=Roseateles saccharophilus TaxID=304 RepID=A0A4V2VPQ3_ROSSA|nr:type II toxin-antitoxin system HicB family antitoxin [Roseateles saccharophilus]MDG0833775.1 type II toxin-antitoxin system HicB family antitoxin [Roseateles saccharophilus]TCU91599.1 putative HicB family RNase H-like nuclease [Roseateles saccharophilus]
MTNATKLYRGYIGSIDVDLEAKYLHGKVLYVLDLVTFTSPGVDGLQTAFEEAVDDYLAMCAQLGKEPDRPFSGAFQVRMTSDQHRALALEASAKGMTLNELSVVKLCSTPVEQKAVPQVVIESMQVNVQSGTAQEVVLRDTPVQARATH